jgi:hypothetical protein
MMPGGAMQQQIAVPPLLWAPPWGAPRYEQVEVARIQVHPALRRFQLAPAPTCLAPLRKAGESLFEQPLIITHEGILLDGHKRWAVARELGREHVDCLVLQMDKEDALREVLGNSLSRPWINAFARVRIALSLTAGLQEKARENQRRGGREKLSTTLTEAPHIDVRAEAARLSETSQGTVSKVNSILQKGIGPLVSACQSNAISIHAAFCIAQSDARAQEDALARHEAKRRERQQRHAWASGSGPGREKKARLLARFRAAMALLHTEEELEEVERKFSLLFPMT